MAFALGFEYQTYLEPREVSQAKGRWRDVDVSGISVDPELFKQFLQTLRYAKEQERSQGSQSSREDGDEEVADDKTCH